MRFAIDYIGVTFRTGSALEIMDGVERGLIRCTPWDDKGYSWNTEPMTSRGWVFRHTFAGGDITLMEGRGFICFEMKGRGCTVTQERIPEFLRSCVDEAGVNATRLDGVWAPFPLDPHELLQHVRGPSFVSSTRKHGAGWIDSSDGRTCSVPPYSKRKYAARFLRLYDAKGYNRLELQLNKPDADDALRSMVRVPEAEWSELWTGYLLRQIDFRVPTGQQTSRRPRCQWWADLVGEKKKAMLSPASNIEPEKTVLSQARGFAWRNARQLHAIIEGAGIEWLIEQVNAARARGRSAEQRTIDALNRELNPPPKADESSKPFKSETWLPF